jgi:tetratricopeptide (TPR) repeat protein
MTEPQPTEAEGSPSGPSREARIERLLLAGLDHYFAGKYEQAIDVWSRVAFLERGHGRARAYIERARRAEAERQRESEELVEAGVAAYHAGQLKTARELLTRSVADGRPHETALLFLQRLNQLEAAGVAEVEAERPRLAGRGANPAAKARTDWTSTILTSAALAAAIMVVRLPVASWLAEFPVTTPAVAGPGEEILPVVSEAEVLLRRVQALRQEGRLHEALAVLERIGLSDGRRAEADDLKAAIQRELLGTPRSGGADSKLP